jgi:hypothetical protein
VVTVATTDGSEAGETNAAARIQDALAAAYESKANYDVAVQLRAAGHDAKPEAHRIRFQQHVLQCVSLLRPYLAGDIPRYWNGVESDGDGDDSIFLYDGEDGRLRGLKDLMPYQGATRDDVQFVDGESQRSEEPVLLPAVALRNALDWVGEAAYQLGFMPKADTRRGKFNVSQTNDEDASKILE